MLKVALTGGIATGKSYVLHGLRKRGIPCLDADALAHGVMAPGTEATCAIAARFGDVLTPEGGVDRKKLGPIVFADRLARRDLEAIVHPAVYRAIAIGFKAFELVDRPRLAVADVPLLFESGHEREFDRIVATLCSESTQRARLRERGLSDEDAGQRLAAQWSAQEKARRAHIVISTDGTFGETDAQIDRALSTLLATDAPS
jgi:dephospho-CoA kinase